MPKENKDKQPAKDGQTCYSTNPLQAPSAEQRAEYKANLAGILATHKKTQIFVAKTFRNNPEPILIDKG